MVISAATLAPIACTSGSRRTHPLEQTRIWEQYRALPEQRALVLAGDPEKVWVAGMAGGEASPAEAEGAARVECERQRQRRRIVDACRVYASGRRVVWGSDEF